MVTKDPVLGRVVREYALTPTKELFWERYRFIKRNVSYPVWVEMRPMLETNKYFILWKSSIKCRIDLEDKARAALYGF